MADLPLTKVSETNSKITFSYPKVAGAEGYRYTVNGNPVSRTFNPDDLEVTFGKVAGATYRVVPLDVTERADGFVWPAVTPPPPGGPSPLGFISNRAPGYFPATHIDSYGVISSEGPAPAGFKGINLVYRSGVTAGAGYTNISEQEAVQKGFAMHDSAGNPVRNMAYGGVLCDPANVAYQQRWNEASVAYAKANQSDGYFMDDTTPQVTDFYGGPYPVEHPSYAQYQQAMLSFMKAVKASCAANGLVNATYNSSVSSDDAAVKTRDWLRMCGAFIGGFCVEYWMTRNGTDVVKMGPEWYNHFPEWRDVNTICQQLGVRHDPVAYGLSVQGGDHGQMYVLCAHLLDWKPGGGAVLWSNPDAGTTQDPWSNTYAQALALGAPTAAAVQSPAGVFTRQFQNGRVTVNANNGTASIS